MNHAKVLVANKFVPGFWILSHLTSPTNNSVYLLRHSMA